MGDVELPVERDKADEASRDPRHEDRTFIALLPRQPHLARLWCLAAANMASTCWGMMTAGGCLRKHGFARERAKRGGYVLHNANSSPKRSGR